MRVLRPTRLALTRLRDQSVHRQCLQLLARAFSDAVDPAERPLGGSFEAPVSSAADSSAPHVNGRTNGFHKDQDGLAPEAVQFLASYQDDEQHDQQDVAFTAQRIGFPISELEMKERSEFQQLQDEQDGGIR
jgi:hypothetical protein